MAIKRGDKLILSLGGVIAVPVTAGNDERYATVMIRHENTWDVVNVKNVEPASTQAD